MEAGKLRHRVTLQRPSGTRDAVGGRVTVPLDVATVWASIETLDGREAFYAAQRQATTTHKVVIRYAPIIAGIDATWRVKYGVRIFTLDEPPRNTREINAELVLMCTEGPRDE